jgi:hypothetical protein
MSDRDLIAIGFVADGNSTLRAPIGSVVTLTPVDGHFYRLAIAVPGGAELFCVVPAAALKTSKPEIDINGLMNIDPSSRRRPW